MPLGYCGNITHSNTGGMHVNTREAEAAQRLDSRLCIQNIEILPIMAIILIVRVQT